MAAFREKWLNAILHTTAFIEKRKSILISTTGYKNFFAVFALIGAEIWLFVISIPLYLVKDAPIGDVHQYRARTVLSKTIMITMSTLLVVKVLLICALFFWNQKNIESARIQATDNALTTHVQQATNALVNNVLIPPPLTDYKNHHDELRLSGTGTAGAIALVYLTQAKQEAMIKIYSTPIEADGTWSLTEEAANFHVVSGAYLVQTALYIPEKHEKSALSNPKLIIVEQNLAERVFYLLSFICNGTIVTLLIFGFTAHKIIPAASPKNS